MNFGAFAGGFSQGFDNGVRQAKTIRDIIKERKLEDLRQAGLEEARTARDAAVNGMVTEAPETPKSGPIEEPAAPTTQPPAVQPKPGPAPSPTESPDAASAATAASSMPPAAKAYTPRWEGDTGPGPNDAEIEARMKAKNAAVTPTQEVSAAPDGKAPAPTGPQAAAAGGMPMPEKPVETPAGRFMVNGKSYATREAALKAADAAAPSTMDFFMKTTVPKLQEEYLAQGDVAKAEAWGKWAQDKKSQGHMMEWSKMYRAAQMGDMEKAADHAFNLYKSYDDGVTPVSKETVKDKAGNVTGFNVRLKNEATGEVTSQFINQRTLIEMGMGGLAPDKMFEMAYTRQKEADKASMDSRIKAQERREKNEDAMALEEFKANRADQREEIKGRQELSKLTLKSQLDEENLGGKERAKVEGKISVLKEQGYTEDQIKGMLPALVGANEYKKTTEPSERRALIASDLVRNDPTFSRLPVAERNKKVDEMMDVIYGEGTPKQDAKGGEKPAAIAEKPMAYNPDLPVKRRKSDGMLFHFVDGQMIPIEGNAIPKAAPAAPAAQGLPQRGASGRF